MAHLRTSDSEVLTTAVQEVSRYQAMANEFIEALRQTVALRDAG